MSMMQKFLHSKSNTFCILQLYTMWNIILAFFRKILFSLHRKNSSVQMGYVYLRTPLIWWWWVKNTFDDGEISLKLKTKIKKTPSVSVFPQWILLWSVVIIRVIIPSFQRDCVPTDQKCLLVYEFCRPCEARYVRSTTQR